MSAESCTLIYVSLIHALQNAELYAHPVSGFQVIETHISWVLLTGSYAYKLKKPVNFGFLDFSSLQKRHHYCEEELRRNRRLAPQLYLEVIAIYGSADAPNLDGDGDIIEYMLKMRQFDPQMQLDLVLARNELKTEHIDQLAQSIAHFHQRIPAVPNDSAYGDSEHIAAPVRENFSQIQKCTQTSDLQPRLQQLAQWSDLALQQLDSIFRQRKREGFVRECHGDMHLRNMALVDNTVIIFDCIEFNKNFYLIDVISEIAFFIMDLEERRQPTWARRLLNRYLEDTGDYRGVAVLTFYKVYRAMVRAKVAALRLAQETPDSPDFAQTYQDFLQYLQLAERYTKTSQPALLINHGLSGSGKSHSTRRLLEQFDVIVIRSDVERKRLFSNKTQTSSNEENLYSPDISKKTYQYLAELAACIIRSGYCVIIDAACLQHWQRQIFMRLAAELACPYYILHYYASAEVLRARIRQRQQQHSDASDADLAVLEQQLNTYAALDNDERAYSIDIDTEQIINFSEVLKHI